MEQPTADLVGVGAGLAGLTAAATAARRGARVVVLDSTVPGGRARTDARDGFLFNRGAHALYRSGEGRAVLGRLGIVPTGGPPDTRHGQVLHDGRLARLPETAGRLARSPLLGVRSKVRLATVLATFGRVGASRLADRSTAAWIDALALDAPARALLEMTIRTAAYSDRFDQLSADAAVLQVQRALGEGVVYLDDGWGSIVDALRHDLDVHGAIVEPGEAVRSIDATPDGWLVRTRTGEVHAASVVIAVCSPVSTRALLPVDVDWGDLGMPVEAACLDLGLAASFVPTHPIVFDLDGPRYLSTHCPPARLAPDGCRVVQLLRYGVRSADVDRRDLWALAVHAGITEDDVVTHRFLRRMVVAHALPRPGRGLAGRPAVVVPDAPNLFVAGDWVGPHGMLADASCASGEAAGLAAADQRMRVAA
jgi:phytoene dehydrogenase-like protein